MSSLKPDFLLFSKFIKTVWTYAQVSNVLSKLLWKELSPIKFLDSLHVTFIIQAQVVQKVDSAINSYQGDNAIASYYLSAG